MSRTAKEKTKTRAEIQRDYRIRQKSRNNEEYLKKARERYHRNRNEGKIKLVADVTEREHRNRKRKWRLASQSYRNKQSDAKRVQLDSPPSSTSGGDEAVVTPADKKICGIKKANTNRKRTYRLIIALKDKLAKERKLKEKYRKRLHRQKSVQNASPLAMPLSPTTSKSTPRSKTKNLLAACGNVPSRVHKTLVFHHTLLDEINEGLEQPDVPNRMISSKVVSGRVFKRYRMTKFAMDSGLKISKKRIHGNAGRSKDLIFDRKTRKDALDAETLVKVHDFYNRDDNSRITTGKKQTATKNKQKMQKRLLSDTLINLHEKFCGEHVDNAISYSQFTRLRPFWIISPTSKDRETCLCRKHDNVQLKCDKLHQLKLLDTKYAESVIAQVCCNTDNLHCMHRECESCANRHVPFKTDGAATDNQQVFWWEWGLEVSEYEKDGQMHVAKNTKKQMKRGTVGELKELFDMELSSVLCPHVYNIRHQFKSYRYLKEHLEENEAVIHVDFSENYICKYHSEIQSCHFGGGHSQATIHTGVYYTSNGLVSFATISDCNRHDASAVWAHLSPILGYLNEENPNTDTLHFFSDGPTAQYRNKLNFYLFSTQLVKHGIQCGTWNMFECGHGKGSPDAIGGALKRKADDIVNRGTDLPDAHKLFDALNADSSVKLFFVNNKQISDMDKMCPKDLKPIDGTMKLHQICTTTAGEISFRNWSCFCSKPTICTCFNSRTKTMYPVHASSAKRKNNVLSKGKTTNCKKSKLKEPVSSQVDTDIEISNCGQSGEQPATQADGVESGEQPAIKEQPAIQAGVGVESGEQPANQEQPAIQAGVIVESGAGVIVESGDQPAIQEQPAIQAGVIVESGEQPANQEQPAIQAGVIVESGEQPANQEQPAIQAGVIVESGEQPANQEQPAIQAGVGVAKNLTNSCAWPIEHATIATTSFYRQRMKPYNNNIIQKPDRPRRPKCTPSRYDDF
jgi:hypothetical protein